MGTTTDADTAYAIVATKPGCGCVMGFAVDRGAVSQPASVQLAMSVWLLRGYTLTRRTVEDVRAMPFGGRGGRCKHDQEVPG